MALLFESWWAELAAVLVTLCAGIYVFFAYKYQYWKKQGVYSPEPSFPFGQVKQMFFAQLSIGDMFKKLYFQLKTHKLAGIYQLWTPILVVNDPETVKTILVKDFAHFHDHGIYFDEKIDPLAAHLFMMEGIKWKHLRYKLAPTFTSGKMKMMFPTLVECGKELQKYLVDIAEKRESLEMKDVLAKYSTDIIATCAFGIKSNSLTNPDSEFRRMGRKIFEMSVWQTVRDLLAVMAPNIAAVVKLRSIPKDISDFFVGIVQETINFREKNNISRNDFMQLMIGIKNKKNIVEEGDKAELKDTLAHSDKEVNYYDANGMTVNEVAAQAFVFFIAGFETSSTTMSFCLHELAVNKEVQDRVRDEVDSVLADHNGEMTYEAVMEMTYLDRVVAETLRKYPPVPVIMRKCNKDYKLPDTNAILKKGTSVFVPVLGIQNDPQYFPSPEKFDPDRFTEEEKAKRHHFTYLPFGEGPRICIGSRFGLMQTKVGLASVLSKYEFDVCPKNTSIPLVMDPRSFIMATKEGINLKISPRS